MSDIAPDIFPFLVYQPSTFVVPFEIVVASIVEHGGG